MSCAAAIKWNERYRAGVEAAFESPRDFLVEQAGHLPDQGLALDIVMGLGGNAGFLIEHGLRVIGVDVSEVGVRRCQAALAFAHGGVINLTHYRWQPCSFDVILNFYYCQRDLWPWYRTMLKPGGVLIMETLTIETLRTRLDYNPELLLQPGELHHDARGAVAPEVRDRAPTTRRPRGPLLASFPPARPCAGCKGK